MYQTFVIIIGVFAVAAMAVIITKQGSVITTLQEADARQQSTVQQLRQLHNDLTRSAAQGVAAIESMRAALAAWTETQSNQSNPSTQSTQSAPTPVDPNPTQRGEAVAEMLNQ